MSEGIDVAEDPSSIIGFACSHNRADTAIEKVSGMCISSVQILLTSKLTPQCHTLLFIEAPNPKL